MPLLSLTVLLACAEPVPETLPACASLSSPTAVEDCRYRLVAPLLPEPKALHDALGQIADDTSRDLLLLRLAVNHPDKASLLCRQTTTPPAQEKCQQVLGRPHLSRRPR